VTGTRKFARRQDAWFRKDDRIDWIDHDDPARVARALDGVGRVHG
jgi:tRNA dimethylallyltransferase